MAPATRRSSAKRWLEIGGVALLYYVTGKLGLALAIPPGYATSVWPPSGIALAAVLLAGFRIWPGILLGSFLVNITAPHGSATSLFSMASPALAALSIAAGSTLQALFGGTLIRRFIKARNPFEQTQDVFKFTGIEILSCSIASTIGVTALCLFRMTSWNYYFDNWLTWWLGDLAGVLVFTPLPFVWQSQQPRRWNKGEILEAATLFVFLFTASQIIFESSPSLRISQYAAPYMVIPFILWAAYRFSPREVMLSVLIILAVWLGEAGTSFGPFRYQTQNEALLTLQVFTGFITVMGLAMAAALGTRKKTEAELAVARERFHGIYESSKDAISFSSLDGVLRDANDAFFKLTGYSRKELIEEKKYTALTPPEYHALDAQKVAQMVEEGKPVEYEKEILRSDGSRIPILLTTFVVEKEGGNKIGLASIIKDVSERKRMDRMKSEFISMISHELKTPLTLIRSSLDIVIRGMAGELSQKASQLLDITSRNCERMTRLVNDILDTQKIEAGKIDFVMSPLDIRALVDYAVKTHQSYAASYGVKIVLEHPLPKAKVRADSDRLMQVLANLLSNAAKFSPPQGEVVVSVSRIAGKIRVTVKDRGPGIPEEFKSRIFKKFSQASDTPQRGGTGLGLWISKAIIEKMGGRIWFETGRDLGTSFHFELPEWESEVTPSAALKTEPRTRVLICEDEQDVATLLALILDEAGFQTDLAHTARQTKQKLLQHHYHALTLDIGLPDQDGISLVRELRSDERTRHLPIVVISAKARQILKELNGENLGIAEWIEKPIDSERVVTSVRQAAQTVQK